ncbi:ribonuclease P [Candidatus Woesearchaeota archaeon]|nr:ribonuclease P [Candidatus Woesearchaeota archaeon]
MVRARKTKHGDVLKRVEHLFDEADMVFAKDKQLANRYIALARRLAMRVNLRLPSHLKRRYCKFCYSYLKPGINLTVRLNNGKLVYYCHECKHHFRMPLHNK